MRTAEQIAPGLCQCGCGARTSIVRHNAVSRGLVAGEPRRYLKGHHPRPPTARDEGERFWEKVDRSAGADACWPWTAALGPSGYGHFWSRGRMRAASRIAHELAKGPIPAGLFVLHSCDNRICCNPAHLRTGTQLDNMREAAERGRVRSGARHPAFTNPVAFRKNRARGESAFAAKLTEAQVLEVRRRAAAGESMRAIARSLDVAHNTINAVVAGRTWRHVS